MRTFSKTIGALDLPWVLLESDRHPMHVAGLIICAPPPGAGGGFVDDLCAQMATFVRPSAPFDRRVRYSLGGRWPRWERWPEVRIEDHLHRSQLPQPGGEPELQSRVAAVHRVPLEATRPMWEVHVIEGLEGNRFAIYGKFHHSLVDGVGAIRILQAAFSADSAALEMPPIWAYPRRSRPRALPRRRRDQLRTVAVAVKAVAANMSGRYGARPYSAPRSMLNTAINSDRTVTTQSWEIERLRRLADAMHGTVNDAFVVVCSTALRHYLLDLDALPGSSLTAAMPVSVRPADGDLTGNAITFAFVSLATDIVDDAQRAAHVVASTAQSKIALGHLTKDVINTYTVLTMAPLVLGNLLGLGAVLRPMFNVAVSNIPGPAERLFYNGATVLEMYPVSLLQSGQALNITALSYGDRLNVTFTACDASLPHLERLTAGCAAAFADLERALPIKSS